MVVDQFEELFRFRESRKDHGSHDEAIAFAKLLLGAANQIDIPVYVVVTMRSDFIVVEGTSLIPVGLFLDAELVVDHRTYGVITEHAYFGDLM